jgi:WD40 repeat protein
VLPIVPFRTLDAPLLRNDFYCSILAYCYTSGLLAVGLCSNVFLWSEPHGLEYPPFPDYPIENYITSLSFSSAEGGRSILAVGRQSGEVWLWSTFEDEVRFQISHPSPVSCVAFKQVTSRRQSTRFSGIEASMEDLAVGDDAGYVWYYSVEWPDYGPEEYGNWDGTITLIAKIAAHKQQICGLAWSPDGVYLATGGNDNACLLFDLGEVLLPHQDTVLESTSMAHPSLFGFQPPRTLSRLGISVELGRYFGRLPRSTSGPRSVMRSLSLHSSTPVVSTDTRSVSSGNSHTILVPWDSQKHRLCHCAAVKAIAFAPWQPSLLATGGGSNDRSVHFYHAPSGSCLATIDVSAQVTSLIWSSTRREIAVTFGFAQPEHPVRIAVFAWPSCEEVAAIPWNVSISGIWDPETDLNVDCGRALWAISHPGCPKKFLSAALGHGHVEDGLAAGDATLSSTEDDSSPLLSTRARTIRRGSIGSTVSTIAPGRGRTGRTWSRTAEEGCIVVAASDESIRFYQVWSGTARKIVGARGLLGHSVILEGLEGIENPGREIIR